MSTTAAFPADPATAVPRTRPFRVHDHTRVLALVTAVLLLSGFGVLRLLTGAADTPQLRTTTVEKPVTPVVEPAQEEVHRLRPQTSGVLPLPEIDPPAAPEEWSHELPLSNWYVLPPSAEIRKFELAREPSMLR